MDAASRTADGRRTGATDAIGRGRPRGASAVRWECDRDLVLARLRLDRGAARARRVRRGPDRSRARGDRHARAPEPAAGGHCRCGHPARPRPRALAARTGARRGRTEQSRIVSRRRSSSTGSTWRTGAADPHPARSSTATTGRGMSPGRSEGANARLGYSRRWAGSQGRSKLPSRNSSPSRCRPSCWTAGGPETAGPSS
jgi:hypothetical protein